MDQGQNTVEVRVGAKDTAQQRRVFSGFLEGEGGKQPGTTRIPQAGEKTIFWPSSWHLQILAISLEQGPGPGVGEKRLTG